MRCAIWYHLVFGTASFDEFCICDVLRDLVPFVQFKKYESNTSPWVFFKFF